MAAQKQPRGRIARKVQGAGILPLVAMVLITLLAAAALLSGGLTRL